MKTKGDEDNILTPNERICYKHHRNQLLTVAGVTVTLFATGNIMGFSAITTYQLARPEATIKADHEDLSWIASLVTIGCVIGTLSGGLLADVLGRKKTIMLASVFFSLGWIVIGFANSVPQILAGRLLTGTASGIYSTTVQVYICEIVDPSIRGVSGSIPTLMVAIGVIAMYTLGSMMNWRILAFFSSSFPLLVLFYMFFLPDSPSWLISKGKYGEAVKALTWLRNDQDEAELEVAKLTRIKERRTSLRTGLPSLKPKKFSIRAVCSRFSERAVLRPLGIGVMLFFFQKFSGVSSITSYATLIFQYADNATNNYVQTIVIGFVRLFTTLISIFLVKYFKRRPLLITSGICMSIATGMLGAFFLVKEKYGGLHATEEGTGSILGGAFNSHTVDCIPLFCITVFMFFSQIGFGVLPFFMVVELLPSDVRSISCSLAYGFCQLCQFIVVKTFLTMLDGLNTYGTFWFYSAVSMCGALFVALCVPETSNLHAAQIEKLFEKKGALDSEDSSSTNSENEDESESGPLLKGSRDEENNYASIRR